MAPLLQRVKKAWRATRAFLASDGILSWLANLAIAFVVIKFLVYPGLGFLFGTSLPVVAVVSSSMDHDAIDGNVCGVQVGSAYRDNLDGWWSQCGAWYEKRGISKETFSHFAFRGGFNKGDIMVILGEQRSSIAVGDVVVFQAAHNYPIIHRVVNVTPEGYQTKGDHNPDQIAEYQLVDALGLTSRCESGGKPAPCFVGRPVTRATPGAQMVIDEQRVAHDAVIGKAVLRIPWLGYVKIWFTSLLQILLGS